MFQRKTVISMLAAWLMATCLLVGCSSTAADVQIDESDFSHYRTGYDAGYRAAMEEYGQDKIDEYEKGFSEGYDYGFDLGYGKGQRVLMGVETYGPDEEPWIVPNLSPSVTPTLTPSPTPKLTPTPTLTPKTTSYDVTPYPLEDDPYYAAAFDEELYREHQQPLADIWRNQVVYITKTGEKYHEYDCPSLWNSCIETTVGDAVDDGYEPCERCNPPSV